MRAGPLLVLFILSTSTLGWAQYGTTVSTAGSAAGASAAAAAGTQTAGAATGTGPDLSAPKVSSKAWTVGFSAFQSEGLSADNAYLGYSLPLMIASALNGVDTHDFSAGESAAIQRNALAGSLLTAEQALSASLHDRDVLLFSDQRDTATLAAADQKVAAAQARVLFLTSLDPGQIAVPAELPLTVKDGSSTAKLFDAPTVPLAQLCAAQGLDLLVGGSLREIQGYLLIDAWAYDAGQAQVVFTYREAAPRDEIYSYMPALTRQLIGVLLGRAWSVLAFLADPPGSTLYVDGALASEGSAETLYLEPGAHEVRVTAPGYQESTQTISLSPMETTTLSVSLGRQTGGTVVVQSIPPGADLYVGSQWMGKTPLELDLPPIRQRGVLSMDGYFDLPFGLSPQSPPAMSFPLQSSLVPREKLQSQARDDFYAAFAWFIVSLPIPVFSYAFTLDQATLERQFIAQGPKGYAQAVQAQSTGLMLYAGYLGGLALSSGLFTWMIVRIVHYVQTANRTEG